MSGYMTPRSLIYSVSLCDSSSALASPSPTDTTPLTRGPTSQLECGEEGRFTSGGPSYGSSSLTDFPLTGKDSSSRKVLFCVHGHPAEACYDDGKVSRQASLTESEHCHSAGMPHTDSTARKKLIFASILCLIFMLGEALGGYFSNSLAIATDAAHLLTDFASFMISLFSIWLAARPATRRMPFGWYRAETIGALTSVIMIWLVTGILVYMAVQRVTDQNFAIEAEVMLITAGIGVIVNLIMGLSLHQHGHSHGGGAHHSHENINVRAAFIHVVGDFIQSAGVFIAAIVIYFKPEWKLVDPICTFVFSVLVMLTTFSIVRDTLTVLMEGKPNGVDFEQVTETFMDIEGVQKIHNLRIWALSLDKIALSAHIAIRPDVNPQKVLTQASRSVRSKYDFFEMTLQIEQFNENMMSCSQCEMPNR